MTSLPSPAALKRELPLSSTQKSFIAESRKNAAAILRHQDSRLACIIGPCSIHDPVSALEYAKKLKNLSFEVESSLFLVMRLFCEKARSSMGWKGLIYDPDLDGSCDLAKGLRVARGLFLLLADLQLPAAAELLDPLVVPYFDDLITWGFIGARTCASQPHRQLASSLSFPIGFKNSIYGEINAAIHGIESGRCPHTYFGIDKKGSIAALHSHGNPLTHLVLRGAESGPNFDAKSIESACLALKRHTLESRLLVDCSHGNSSKDHGRQALVFQNVLRQIDAGSRAIAGVMIESHLMAGNQRHPEHPASLHYGLSITDSCIGWEETQELLLGCLPISISSVQN